MTDARAVSGFRLKLILALLALAVVLVPVPGQAGQPTHRLFRVNAEMFEYSPAVLTASPGDTVTIELAATDVVHGLYIDGYDVSVIADPGNTARLSFVADRPGSFRFRCSVTCGPLHPFMIGVLRVGPNWLLWRAGVLTLIAAAFGIVVARG
jgi:heme/copper-type cytochrome/quinol oxidase subunit 2